MRSLGLTCTFITETLELMSGMGTSCSTTHCFCQIQEKTRLRRKVYTIFFSLKVSLETGLVTRQKRRDKLQYSKTSGFF